MELPEQSLRAWVDYLRDMGVYDLYHRDPVTPIPQASLLHMAERLAQSAGKTEQNEASSSSTSPAPRPATPPQSGAPPRRGAAAAAPVPPGLTPVPQSRPEAPPAATGRSYFNTEPGGPPPLPPELAAPMPKPNPLASLLPMPVEMVPQAERPAALERVRAEIGDCTRCPLAYAGRHTIVFGEGNASAELMFVGEGPGADEDETGRPFVGKAGQLLNNMIGAMGLTREQVYIANIVKCRPPANRTPEFVEATTCSPFLLQQIDVIRPKVIVALGSTAATYLLGVRQTLASLRGTWFPLREAKVAVTFHPAFLLRDPRQKAEAWKDLQRVMAELQLRPAERPAS